MIRVHFEPSNPFENTTYAYLFLLMKYEVHEKFVTKLLSIYLIKPS